MSVIPVNSNCRPSGEIFIDVCLMARSSDSMSVAAAIITPHGCCSCHHCIMQGVVGAVIAPCGSCPHHMSSLSLPSIAGPGGPLRERWPCTSARRQYLAAKEKVSKEKK